MARCSSQQLPSPLTSYAATSLYGTDCSEWCLNGTTVLQPREFGSTNQYCTDERGCYWKWRMHIVPCSMSLLSFDAEVGNTAAATLFSTIDSAAAATLGFYCSESDGDAVLELRSTSAAYMIIGPLMQWRYRQIDCATLLDNLAASTAPFAGSSVNVQLGVQQWFGSGAERLEALEVDCADAAQQATLGQCRQCFAGTQLAPLPRNASALLTQACGFMPGDAAVGDIKACPVRWRFCYDVCADRSSDVAVRLGGGGPLADVQERGARAPVLRAGEPDGRGRTLFALTDADSVQALDDGYASFYVAWEYREAPSDALWRADGRDALFVAMHFALVTRDGEQLSALHQIGELHALGAYAWDGSAPTGMDALVHAASSMSAQEAGFLAGFIVASACCVMGWSVALILWLRQRRGGEHHDGFSLLGVGNAEADHAVVGVTADLSCMTEGRIRAEREEAQRQTRIATAQKRVTELRTQPDYSHLTMERDEAREHAERRAVELAQAERELDAALAENGGRLQNALRALPGGTSLMTAYRSGGYEYQRRTGQATAAQKL